MARATKNVRLPAELQDHIAEHGGEANLGEGWLAAYRHALNHGNVHKGCVLYADAHHGDFVDAPVVVDDDDDDTDD